MINRGLDLHQLDIMNFARHTIFSFSALGTNGYFITYKKKKEDLWLSLSFSYRPFGE